jgi:hypothetical protein
MIEDSPFRVYTKVRYGIRGLAVIVRVTERLEGTNDIFLPANSFIVDASSLPDLIDALKSALLKTRKYEKRHERLISGEAEG